MEELEKYWLEKYQQDKVGTIAKLSQAMQHMAWLREWQRIHGDSPRIKPITEKVNGEKKKVGEADIAVPWSKLDDFFKKGNEYGDIETVKFLAEKIEQGDISELTEEQLLELAEKENVKWSDGKHSLNPLQGYLYDFVKKGAYILETPLGEQDYGKFYPITEYMAGVKPVDLYEDKKDNEVHKAFSRYYTTRLMQDILSKMPDSKYADFVNFDITSVTTPEQIEELDKKLAEIVQSPEIQDEMEELEGDKEYEAMIYERLKQEIETEIKKDTDRIENAHKVFVALESGNLEEILQDEETLKWAEQIKSREIKERNEKQAIDLINEKSEPKGVIMTVRDDKPNGDLEGHDVSEKSSVVSYKIRELIEKYEMIDKNKNYRESYGHYGSETYEHKITFREYDESDLEDKQKIREYEKKTGDILISEDEKYDKPGKAFIKSGDKTIEFEMTPRELAERGILYEDLGWKDLEQIQAEEKARVTPKDIAETDKGQALTTTEVGGIKGFFKRLMDKIKGKGEK